MAAFVDAGTSYGVWRKTGSMHWELKQDLSSADAHVEGVIGFSRAVGDRAVAALRLKLHWQRESTNAFHPPYSLDARGFEEEGHWWQDGQQAMETNYWTEHREGSG